MGDSTEKKSQCESFGWICFCPKRASGPSERLTTLKREKLAQRSAKSLRVWPPSSQVARDRRKTQSHAGEPLLATSFSSAPELSSGSSSSYVGTLLYWEATGSFNFTTVVGVIRSIVAAAAGLLRSLKEI